MRNYFISALIFSCFSVSHAQIFSPDHIQITGGISFPTYPNSFYDYWMNGFGVNTELIYKSEGQIDGTLSLGYDRFAFDKAQLFKKLQIEENKPSFDGAVTSIISFGGNIRYLVPEYTTVRPFVSAGIALVYSHISETRIEYEYSPAVQNANNSIAFSVPVGAYLEYSFKENYDLVFAVKHYYGIASKTDANTNFTVFRIGITLFLKTK